MQVPRSPSDPAAARPTPPPAPSSWASSLIRTMARSWRSVTEPSASSTTTTTTAASTNTASLSQRTVRVGLPATPAAPGQDRKEAKQKDPLTLATLWPGHAWRDGPVRALCQDLIKQNGKWKQAAVFEALRKISEEEAEEFGEFAAYLQAHPSLWEAPVISQWLADLSVPAFSRAARHPRDPHGLLLVGGLVNGLARGLMRTEQTYSLVQVLVRLLDAQRLRRFDGLARTVVELRDHVNDLGLREVMAALHNLQLPDEQGLLRQCRQLARSDAVAVTALHRVVRLATRHPFKSQVPCHDWYADWLRLLAAPPAGEGAIPPARQFALGHAAATACLDYAPSRPSLQAVLDGKHTETPGPQALPPPQYAPPQPTPAARAGVLWALDPMASLAALPLDPEAALNLGAWLDLEKPARQIGPVRLYQQLEALDLPFNARYRLQRLVLRQEGAFAAVRASLLPTPALPASPQVEGLDEGPVVGADADDALAAALSRLMDLYRYFGEREGLDFAFGDSPDLARIRQEQLRVHERMGCIEAAMRELEGLAPPSTGREAEPAPTAFLRDGLAAVARLTLGESLRQLQANHALALASELRLERDPGPHKLEGKGDKAGH